MADAAIIRLLGQLDRAMIDLRKELERKSALKGVRQTLQISASQSPWKDEGYFAVYLESVNDVGYELCWALDVTESNGRYIVLRGLYGSGRSDRYRGGQQLVFELPDVTFESQVELCARAMDLVKEFQESIDESLRAVPND